MTWEPEIEELKRRQQLARAMGGAENVERQHKAGRLTVRERIERLLDRDSFHETGALAGVAKYEGETLTSIRPANFVMGTGRIDGRRVVERAFGTPIDKESLGGWKIQVEAGAVDNVVDSEDEAFAQIRRVLGYLPRNVWEMPPRATPADDPRRRQHELLSIIPRNRRRPYDVRTLVRHVVDRDSFLEVGAKYGPSLVAGLARLDGYPVGVMANDPMHSGGALTADGSEKMTRMVDLCDTFHLPVVNFVDNPGFLIGTQAEKAGTIRKGVRALQAVYQASVPWITIIVRRVFGVAGAGHANVQALNLRYAWPSGDWGSLPLEGGIEAAYKRELEAAPDRAALLKEIEARLNVYRSPFRTAEAFNGQEIIDPRDTRPDR